MAWVTEYDMTWKSTTANGYIYLQRDGGSYQKSLRLQGDSLEIRNVFSSWEDPIGRLNCSFAIINDLDDFYELIPLITISVGQIKVVVTHETSTSAGGYVMFEGYLNCETVDQVMLQNTPIILTASGYLSKLGNDHPTSIDTLDYQSLINIIIDCLAMTGSTDPLYVNIGMYENNTAPANNQTLFNRITVFSEVWWRNNIERMSALEILTSIMRSFNCFLYWHNQKWYIKHYEDLGNLSPHYVIYDITSQYGYVDTGTVYDPTIWASDIHGSIFHKQIGWKQKLSVNPGLKQYVIRLELKQYFNLFYPDLVDMNTTTTAEPTLHKRRQWWGFVNPAASPLPLGWSKLGEPFRNISNAVYRSGYDITSGSGEVNGLTTRFNLTAHWDTELIIKFKFGVHSQAQFWISGLVQDRTITFYWYLSTYDQVLANRDFFDNSDDSLDTWTYVPNGDPTVNFNTVVISGADLDPDLHTYEATINIPIGDIAGVVASSGDENHLDLVFRLGHEVASQAGESDKPANSCYYGDISAAITEAPHDNLLEGEITTDFLDKKTISLDLFNAGWSYRNSLYKYISAYEYNLAEDWTYAAAAIDDLSNWLMVSKFRLYRIARQKITMALNVPSQPIYGLLGVWEDSKQATLTFIQLSTIYLPQSNTQFVELYEYDDAETVNLI